MQGLALPWEVGSAPTSCRVGLSPDSGVVLSDLARFRQNPDSPVRDATTAHLKQTTNNISYSVIIIFIKSENVTK